PLPSVSSFKMRLIAIEKWRPGVVGPQGRPVLCAPALLIIDVDFANRLAIRVEDGHGEVHPALSALYLVSVLPAILRVRGIVQQHKYVTTRDLVHVAQPGKVVRLVDCDDHACPVLTMRWWCGRAKPLPRHQSTVRRRPSSNN